MELFIYTVIAWYKTKYILNYNYRIYIEEIWGNAKEAYLNPFNKLQKRSVPVITHSHYRSHTELLFSKLDVLPFGKFAQYRISLTMFKFRHGQVPDSISSRLQLNSDALSYTLEETMSLYMYITHFLFKLCTFGTKNLDVLALMFLFPNLKRFLKLIFSFTGC